MNMSSNFHHANTTGFSHHSSKLIQVTTAQIENSQVKNEHQHPSITLQHLLKIGVPVNGIFRQSFHLKELLIKCCRAIGIGLCLSSSFRSWTVATILVKSSFISSSVLLDGNSKS